MKPVLAVTYHDPQGLMASRIDELWPGVADLFDGLAANVTQVAAAQGLAALERAGAAIHLEDHAPLGNAGIGKARREAVALAVSMGAHIVLYADLDHALRWGERDGDEMAAVLSRLGEHDFTVLGRTTREIAALPATLRDTETIVNRVFAEATGWSWDVMSGVRGLSVAAASALVADRVEDSIANDVAWPMWLRARGFSVGYLEAGGLVYEDAEQFAARGDVDAWRRRLESDPRAWANRLRLALLDVETIGRYTRGQSAS